MLRIALLIIILVHGFIHIFGILKAFHLASMDQLHQQIGKFQGIMWGTGCLLLLFSAIHYFQQRGYWWLILLIAICFSQILIQLNWSDAKFGTILNVFLLIVALVGFFGWKFENEYKTLVNRQLMLEKNDQQDLLTDEDIQNLPELIQKYIRYTGSVNKPKVKNFRVAFKGKIRSNEKSEWMPFSSEQYNFIDSTVRLFFMKAGMMGLPVYGFHKFINGEASMDIRLFSLFKVQYQSGMEMNIAETVTFFNDMCVMAPGSLIDPRVNWLETEKDRVKAKFVNGSISITAWLYFNEQGQLVNFISEDRFASNEDGTLQKLNWMTPMKDYKEFHDIKLSSYADAIYKYPDRDLCYGIFQTKSVDYNLKSLSK